MISTNPRGSDGNGTLSHGLDSACREELNIVDLPRFNPLTVLLLLLLLFENYYLGHVIRPLLPQLEPDKYPRAKKRFFGC